MQVPPRHRKECLTQKFAFCELALARYPPAISSSPAPDPPDKRQQTRQASAAQQASENPRGVRRPAGTPSHPTDVRKKKTPFRGPLNFFLFLNDLLIFFLFHLVDQGFKSIVEGLFERLGRTFYEEVMLGNMNSDLRNLVFDGVNYIVQLQEHINFDNSVMECV
jgi:hypothetical protein